MTPPVYAALAGVAAGTLFGVAWLRLMFWWFR